MKTFLKLVLALVVLELQPAFCQTANSVVCFENDLIPIFTKHGCNSGACHGAAVGRGGFKLSLYGSDPAADYKAVALELEGRRVNLADPALSLLLLKPTEAISHGGGYVLEDGHADRQTLLKWIAQGAVKATHKRLERVEVSPTEYVAARMEEPLSLTAVAHYADGSQRDVTATTVFIAEDNSAVEIDPETARVKFLRPGRHIVIARYLSEVLPIELIVPLGEASGDWGKETRTNFIDDELLEAQRTLGLSLSPRADDATLLRRMHLDLTGRLPTVEQLRQTMPPDQKLIEELLNSPAFVEYWTLQLAKLLRIRASSNDTDGANVYHRWLSEQLAADVGYDQIARNLILADGDSRLEGPANFYRTVSGPREQVEFMSEVFMGSRLRCANCHNHPLDRWTQDDYHGLAAIFAKVDAGVVVKPKPNGEVIHPRTLEAAIPRIPGGKMIESVDSDPRLPLANWLVDSDNPTFAKAMVNRLWKSMMGRGLVEPVDDFRATNPATHPELLEKLATDFVDHGYSIRRTLKLIASSEAYARSSIALETNRADDRFYSHAPWKPLEAEVLADMISDVLAVSEQYGNVELGARAVVLEDAKIPSMSLDILGRCDREESCEGTLGSTAGLTQKLHLFNGPLLNARLSHPQSRLNAMIANGVKPREIVVEFYRVALCREPNSEELDFWQTRLQHLPTEREQHSLLEDFVWGLLCCREFSTNH